MVGNCGSVVESDFYTKLKKLDLQEGKKDKLFAAHVTQVCEAHNQVMMMIAFITVRSSLVPLIEGLCAQIYFRFEISVVCVHIFCFSFSEE